MEQRSDDARDRSAVRHGPRRASSPGAEVGPAGRSRPIIAIRDEGPMSDRSTLILRDSDVASFLPLADCITVLEEAYRLEAGGKTLPSGILGVPANDGGFHV